jgi:DNA-directed RNA polymerase specialized sigma24 family protein
MSTGVTHWIGLLKAGDPAAAQPLWEHYCRRLVRLARARLRGARRRVADENDVALSAFHSLCRGARAGRFPQVTDSDDLWRLLVVITARKAVNVKKHERRAKRGGGRVRGESAFLSPAEGPPTKRGLEEVIGAEPTPEFTAEMAEECRRLLDRLEDETLRSIALWKLGQHTNKEIADFLDCSVARVERKLQRIRALWKNPEGG